MKQVDFINGLVKDTEFSKKQAGEFFGLFCDKLQELLKNGDSLQLPGVGVLKVAEVRERTSYNPAHKQKEVIPAHKRVRFTQSTVLTTALKG